MPSLPSSIFVRRAGAIVNVFLTYGDTLVARTAATQILLSLLRSEYGEAYQYILYGNAVENGLITRLLVDEYNTQRASLSSDALAMEAITAANLVNINFIARENPTYIYPWYYEYRISPYSTIDRFLYNPLGVQNFKYLGCKLSGTGVNIDSTETVDGGPVVKVTAVNQNQIVFSNNNVLTARANTSGLPVRQLTTFRTNSSQGGTVTNIPDAQIE